VLIEGKVYDVTTYLAEHPGGDDILLRFSGKDATKIFKSINNSGHTEYAISIRDQRLVGTIESGAPPKEYLEFIKELDKSRT
jgi:cytochrome b involved in lipid metabolism